MEYLLKSALISTVLYSFYKVFLQKETFFQSIRIYFIIGIIASIILPIVIIPIYIEVAPIVVSEILGNTPFTENLIESEVIIAPIETKEAINWLGLMGTIYLIGVIVFTIKFLIDLASLMSLLLYGRKTKTKKYIFVETEKEISPFSFFKFIVYNKNKFSKTELKDIIAHEKAHVQQKHSLDILLIQLLTIVQWYNPFVWLYKKDLQQNLEYIADKEAQEKAETHKEYQYLLLKTSIKNNPFALSNNFFNSHLKKRIMMLQKSQTKRLNQIKYLLLIPLLAIFLYAFNTKEVIKPQSENSIINWNNNSNKIIVIDVSHGGKDTGANVENVLEKDIVLEISKKIKALYKGDAIIKFTREKDEFIKLNDRINIVNKLNPSLLISLHVNRAKNSKARGLSAYVSEKNNAFEESKIIANELLSNIANKDLKSRGVSKGNLKIIKEVTSPAVLLELGFLSNEKDRNYIKSNKGQTEIAKSIVDFINGKKTIIKIDKNQDLKFINPIYKENIIKITSGFGKRKSPITKEIKFHNGIDIKAHIGTDVYATADGKVIKAEYNGLKGNYIQIQHANKYQTNYHHLGKIQIAIGEQVKAGDIISTVGNTGKSTGPHLHYEVLKEGKHVNPVSFVKIKSNFKQQKSTSSKYSINTATSNKFKFNTKKSKLEITITSKTTDKEFKKIKKQFKKQHNVELKFYEIKRNKNKEIIAIKIDGKAKGTESSFSFRQDYPIAKIIVAYDKDKNEIFIENKDLKKHHKKGTRTKSKTSTHHYHSSTSTGTKTKKRHHTHLNSEVEENEEEIEEENTVTTYEVNGRKRSKEVYERMDKSKNLAINRDANSIHVMALRKTIRNSNKKFIIINKKRYTIDEANVFNPSKINSFKMESFKMNTISTKKTENGYEIKYKNSDGGIEERKVTIVKDKNTKIEIKNNETTKMGWVFQEFADESRREYYYIKGEKMLFFDLEGKKLNTELSNQLLILIDKK